MILGFVLGAVAGAFLWHCRVAYIIYKVETSDDPRWAKRRDDIRKSCFDLKNKWRDL